MVGDGSVEAGLSTCPLVVGELATTAGVAGMRAQELNNKAMKIKEIRRITLETITVTYKRITKTINSSP